MHVQKLTRRQSTALYSVPNQVSSFLCVCVVSTPYMLTPQHDFLVQLGVFLNTIKRILDVLHCRVEDILKSWASYLPVMGDRKSLFGEQMNGITVLLRTKYKNYLQATVEKLVQNVSPLPFPFLVFSFTTHKIQFLSYQGTEKHSSKDYCNQERFLIHIKKTM